MAVTGNKGDAIDVDRLLAEATRTMARVRSCWLVTLSDNGNFSARPMGRLPREEGDAEWTIRFITDRRSHKATQIRCGAKVAVIFQHDAADAYVKASGPTHLHEGTAEVSARWTSAYDVYFPTERDRINASFIEVSVESLELWIRGVTPDPFGSFPTILERRPSAGWQLVSVDSGTQ